MTTKEARNLIANAVAAGKIDLTEATRRQNHLSEIASGKLYGSSVSWKRQRELNALWVSDLI